MKKKNLIFVMLLLTVEVAAQPSVSKSSAFREMTGTNFKSIKSHHLVSKYRQANLNGKARIVLIAEDVFKEGCGYQLLLDADCNTYDKVSKYGVEYKGSDYSDYEYTIPMNADAVLDTKNMITDGKKDSIDIPAGLYDMCILTPVPSGGCIYFARDQQWKEVNFSGDFVYTFHVHMGSNTDETTSTLKYDLGVSQKWDWGISELSEAQQVQFVLNNYGHEAYDQHIKCHFQIDKQSPEMYELPELPEAGKSSTVVFPQSVDLSELRTYDIKIWIEDPLGWTTFNDTLRFKVNNYSPIKLPYTENFDFKNYGKFINQWKILNLNNDQTTWYFEEAIECNEDMLMKSGSMGYTYHALNEANDLLASPCIEMKKGKHTLSFKSRPGSTDYSEKLNIYVNTKPSIEGAQLIDKLTLNNGYWLEHSFNFEMPEESPAYVLFHMVSSPNQYLLFIDEVKVTHDPSGISGAVENGISLYPSVVEDYLYIRSTSTPIESIKIYTIAGNLIYHSETSTNDSCVDFQTLTKGVYVVQIQTSLGSKDYKIIKI